MVAGPVLRSASRFFVRLLRGRLGIGDDLVQANELVVRLQPEDLPGEKIAILHWEDRAAQKRMEKGTQKAAGKVKKTKSAKRYASASAQV